MNDSVLSVNDLTKTHKNASVPDRVTFSLERGHIYALLGGKGAGKTTLMRMIAGLADATGGTISLFGSKNDSELRQARRRAGFLIDVPVCYEQLPPYQNLVAQSAFYGKTDKDRIRYLLEEVGLPAYLWKHSPMRACTSGDKQRYGIAFALLHSPELIVLDEPFNGLDAVGISKVRRMLKRLCVEEHATVLMTGGKAGDMVPIATDILFMDQGKIVGRRTAEQLRAEYPTKISIRSDNPARIEALLIEHGCGEPSSVTQDTVVLVNPNVEFDDLDALFTENGISAFVSRNEADLEAYIRKMTEEAAK